LTCSECGSALAADQRYCLSCGARNGPRAAALERILSGLDRGRLPGTVTRIANAAGSLPSAAPPPRAPRGLLLPTRLTAAALTLAMLGFGTLAGDAASNPAGALAALRRGPLTLLMPAPAVSTTAAASAAPPPVASTPTPATSPAEPVSAESAESAAGSAGGAGGGNAGGGASAGGSGAGGAGKGGSGKGGSGKGGSGKGGSGSNGSNGSGASGGVAGLPPIKHVFLIMLADEPYAQTFGPESPAPYLSHTLERRGELLVRYYAVAHEELANEIALISGLGPTPQIAANCPTYADIVPTIANKEGQYGGGDGCIYPRAAQTVGEQLTAKKLTWRVYAQGMGAGGPPACRHPEFGASDPTYAAPPGDEFATFRDPFSYFDGVIHAPECAHEDIGMEGLSADLKSAARTPTFSYIVPDLCDDGRPTPCAPDAPSGLPAANAFLRRVVPEILAAPAYRRGGLLIVTTDQAPPTGEYADSSACCVQPRFAAPSQPLPSTAGPATTTSTTTTPATTTPAPATPAAPTPASTTPAVQLPPSGGGQVGALLLSPYVKAGTANQEPFNDFSLLRTLENLFGLAHLGYAALPKVEALGASVFNGVG